MGFRYPPGLHFPQKYDHTRPQGRPHEKEFKLFSNTKINVTIVGTEKKDEKIDVFLVILCCLEYKIYAKN